MLMPNLETYFLEVSAHVSIKVVTSNSFKDKKNLEYLDFWIIYLKVKRRNATKKSKVSLINSKFPYPVEMHIIWNLVHTFHLRQALKIPLEGKKIPKFSIAKAFLRKQEWRSVNKKIEVPFINLTLLDLVHLHIFRKKVPAFH